MHYSIIAKSIYVLDWSSVIFCCSGACSFIFFSLQDNASCCIYWSTTDSIRKWPALAGNLLTIVPLEPRGYNFLIKFIVERAFEECWIAFYFIISNVSPFSLSSNAGCICLLYFIFKLHTLTLPYLTKPCKTQSRLTRHDLTVACNESIFAFYYLYVFSAYLAFYHIFIPPFI